MTNTVDRMADVILALSGTCNARVVVEGFLEFDKRTVQRLAHRAKGNEERRITYVDTQVHSVPVMTSPECPAVRPGGCRYSPFTINIEHLKSFHTSTGGIRP
nr:hypothetical protein [Mycobacterium lepromatosis]